MMRALLVAAFVIVAAGPALAQETTPRYERRTLDEWTQDLDDAAPAARRKAVFALGQFGSPALAAVTRALADPEPSVRVAAATVGRRLGPGALPLLIRSMSDEDSSVRKAAAESLPRSPPTRRPS
jgi:HEAT repeat protein